MAKLLQILLCLSLLTPVVVFHGAFVFPFITSKVLYLRSVTELVFALWLIGVATRPERLAPRATPIGATFGLFLASAVISTLLGVDVHRSLWGTHERMLGLFTLLHYGLLYLVFASVVRDDRSWRNIFLVLLTASSVAMVVAVIQVIEPSFFFNRGVRVDSTLGHPGYLGGLGAFSVLTGALFALRESSSRLRAYFILCSVLGLLGIAASQARGSMVALACAVAVTLLCAGFAVRERRLRRLFLSTLALVALSVSIIAVLAVREPETLARVPGLSRFAGVSLEKGTAHTRRLAWGISLRAGGERPLVGWGPGNFYYAFNRFYRPEFLEHGYEETWWDHAHNEILNTFVVQGSLGLVLYLALFGVPIVLLWLAWKRGRVDVAMAALGSGILTAQFVQNLFLFENPTSYLYFVVWLAFVDRSVHDRARLARPRSSSRAWLSWIALPGALAVVWIANVEVALSSAASLRSLRMVDEGDAQAALAELERAVSGRSPHADGARNVLAARVLQRFDAYVAAGRSLDAVMLGERMYRELGGNAKLHPADVHIAVRRGNLALKLATASPDPERIRKMVMELESARSVSPQRQEILFVLSALKIELQQPDQAVALIVEAIELDPRVGEGWWRLAFLYELMGLPSQADQVLSEAKRAGADIGVQGQRILESLRR